MNDNAKRPLQPPPRGRAKKARGRPGPNEQSVGREGLIAVTREILKSTPPSEITRRMVASKAGVDPTLIRYYFGTVNHLIAHTLHDTFRRIQERTIIGDPGASPRERMHARVGAIIDMFIDNPQHHQLIIYVLYGGGRISAPEEWAAGLRPPIGRTAENLKKFVDAGIFRDVDPRLFFILMLGLGEVFGGNAAFIADMYDNKESIATLRNRYVDFIVDLLFHGLRPIP